MKTGIFFMTIGLLFAVTAGHAQKSGNAVWKKTAARIIDLKEKEDTKQHHLKNAGNDKNLAEMMVDDIKAGKVIAYSSYTADFSTKLSANDIVVMITQKPDTLTIEDPVTGKQLTKVVRRDVNYDAIQKFRLLEEWAFNPATGKTELQITGIAPVREIYGEDGSFRGLQGMFWLRYADARPIIDRYEQYHPNNTIAGHIWDDYFLSDVKPEIIR